MYAHYVSTVGVTEFVCCVGAVVVDVWCLCCLIVVVPVVLSVIPAVLWLLLVGLVTLQLVFMFLLVSLFDDIYVHATVAFIAYAVAVVAVVS